MLVVFVICTSDFQRLMRSSFEPSASRLTFADSNSVPPSPKTSNTRAARLSDDTAPGTVISIHHASDAGRQTRDRRNPSTPVAVAVTKKRAKATRGSTRRRGNGGITLSDVTIRGERAETRGLRVQSLHVGHGFLCPQERAGRSLRRWGQVG